jgi:hypothetical protein
MDRLQTGSDQNMATSNRFEVVEGVGYYRLSGNLGFPQAVKAILEAIIAAREQGLRTLLVDILEACFESPGVAERHAMVRAWAEAAQGMLKIAMVAPPAFIDSEKFGVVAAANFGLTGDVFRSEVEALAWLGETK